jgi:hypothetical protein
MQTIIIIFGIIFLNIILFYRTLDNGLCVDDIRWYKTVKDGYFKCRPGGWLRNILFIISQRLYGGCTFGVKTSKKSANGKEVNVIDLKQDHIFRIALHTLACILIYLALGKNVISLTAALLYTMNPANTQTSVWLNGRRYLVNVILVLLMLLINPVAGIFVYLMTPLFQLTALFAPLLYMNISPWYLIAIPILLLMARKEIIGKIEARKETMINPEIAVLKPNRIIIIIKSLGWNFFHTIFPGHTRMVYESLYWWGRTAKGNQEAYGLNKEFHKGVLALIILVFGALILQGQLLSMWLFMACAIIQWCCIIPVVAINADRYMSVANVFLMYFIAYLSYTYLGLFGFVPPAILGAYYLSHLFLSMKQYRSIQDFFNYHLYMDPHLPNMRCEEVKSLLGKKNLLDNARALTLMNEGIKYHKLCDYNTLMYAALATRQFGNFDEAVILANMAMNNKYLGWDEIAQKNHDDLMQRIDRDKELSKPPSRQVRRAMERKLAKHG